MFLWTIDSNLNLVPLWIGAEPDSALSMTCWLPVTITLHGMKNNDTVGAAMKAMEPTEGIVASQLMLALSGTVNNVGIIPQCTMSYRGCIVRTMERNNLWETIKSLLHAPSAVKPGEPVVQKRVRCGYYGCTNTKDSNAVFCYECYLEWCEDLDAFK